MYGCAQSRCLYGGGASWLRCSVFGHIQAPICLVWVVFLLYRAVFLHCNHLYICYGAALLSLGLIGGGEASSCCCWPCWVSETRVLLRTDVRLWHHLLYLVIFLSCYLFVWSYLVILFCFCLLSYIFLSIHLFGFGSSVPLHTDVGLCCQAIDWYRFG